ncbi:predicted protein [Nematostella vectensis]|uniref:WSC domain-containing protein n=1 Tax=Nematostella vectensis TaxID=45351 RepID=A7SIZ3_NEMVE|nr:predicted protein [Nematostella vectensis]|eukprot:XP_001628394.1 predicted protein [Nematostella vectensis]
MKSWVWVWSRGCGCGVVVLDMKSWVWVWSRGCGCGVVVLDMKSWVWVWSRVCGYGVVGVGIKSLVWAWSRGVGYEVLGVGMESWVWIWSRGCGYGVVGVGMESWVWVWSRGCGYGVMGVGMESWVWVWNRGCGRRKIHEGNETLTAQTAGSSSMRFWWRVKLVSCFISLNCIKYVKFPWIALFTRGISPDLYVGCYRDSQDRDLGAAYDGLHGLTPAKCIAWCADKGFLFAGAQNGGQCFCDNSYGKWGKRSESSCHSSCNGDRRLKCGGVWSNSVFKVASSVIGCYNEGSPRDLWGDQSVLEGSLSYEVCIERCKAKKFFFAAFNSYTKLCSCGVTYGRYGRQLQGSQCTAGNASKIFKTGLYDDYLQKENSFLYTSPQGTSELSPDYVIYTASAVKSMHVCAQYCEYLPRCRSINYSPATMVCEMNNVTSSMGTSAAREQFSYWEPVEVIVLH